MDFWPVVGYALVAFHGPLLKVSTLSTPGWRGLLKSASRAPRPVKTFKNEKLSLCYFFLQKYFAARRNRPITVSDFLSFCRCRASTTAREIQTFLIDSRNGRMGATHFDENISLIGAIYASCMLPFCTHIN